MICSNLWEYSEIEINFDGWIRGGRSYLSWVLKNDYEFAGWEMGMDKRIVLFQADKMA